MKNELIIVAGCSGSGKTTVAKKIYDNFKSGWAQIICLDRFYLKDKNKIPKLDKNGNINFDHPLAFDWHLLIKSLKNLLNNKSTIIPIYNYKISDREKHGELLKPTKFIILEGIMPLYNNEISSLAVLKVFVDTPLDECFIRRLLRDKNERGRSIQSIVDQWLYSVRPMYIQYVEPTKTKADLILPWHKLNEKGSKYLTEAIKHIPKRR